jgi:plastocyanin
MLRGGESLGGLRPLALAVVVATSLLAPVGISAQAAEDDVPTETAPTSEPVVPTPVPDPGETASVTPPSAPAASPSSAPPTAVTVSRASAASQSVSIVDFAFKPSSITVNMGDTVKWTNNGKAPEGHDVTGDGLDSGLLKGGESYSHKFKASGTFSYICTIHPQMKGSVNVLASSTTIDSPCPSSSCGSGTGSPTGVAGTTGSGVAGTTSAPSISSDPAGGLPLTGWDPMWLVTVGLLFLDLGLALRLFGPARTGG